jgi:pentatricopeptide repeat protein
MQSYGIAPDIVSFNSIIHSMSVAKQWLRATELFPLMEEFGEYVFHA